MINIRKIAFRAFCVALLAGFCISGAGVVHAGEETPANAGGAGGLMVAPTRVTLDDKTRTGEVMLINRSNKEETYRISLHTMRMTEDGSLEEITEANPAREGEKSAADVVRYSPRQVTLAAGESQSVRFAVRNMGKMEEGEYRSHIEFKGEPDMSMGADIAAPEGDDKNQISVRLIPVFSISIPLIVRHGDLSATATLSDASVNGDKLTLTIHRQGTASLYGDVEVTKGDTVVGVIRGIAVYVPNEKRKLDITLSPPEGVSIKGANLNVTFRQRQDEGGATLAETTVRG